MLANKLPAGTEIDNIRLVNKQPGTTNRRRRDVSTFEIQFDATTTVEVPVSTQLRIITL